MGTKRGSKKVMKALVEAGVGSTVEVEVTDGKVTGVVTPPDPMPTVNPTYVFRFVVLANALKSVAKHDYCPVPNMTSKQLIKKAQEVTGSKSKRAEKQEELVRTLIEIIHRGVIVCPSCLKATVIAMPKEVVDGPWGADGTTHVCHFYLGGCDTGFHLDAEAEAAARAAQG